MKVEINYTINRTIEAEIDDKYKKLLDDIDSDLESDMVKEVYAIINKLKLPDDDSYVDSIISKEYRDGYGRNLYLFED